MQRYQDSVLLQNSVNLTTYAGSDLTVQVNVHGGGLATIYSDNGVNGINQVSNPIITDALGNFYFYAADGHYDIIISGNNINTITKSDVLLEDRIDEFGGSIRPVAPLLYQWWFDSVLGQPVWCTQVSPAIWVNSAGVQV